MSPADAEYEALIVDPQIRQFVEYLRGKRGAATYPSRAALDPLDFRYVLGDVVIIEAHRSPDGSEWPWHFRYRLVGANVVERDGYNLANKTLEDLPEPEYRERVRATWLDVCETGKPAYHLRELVLDGRLRCYEVVVVPLAGNGEDIDMLISVQRETKPAVAVA
jgi:hypothetical protein